MYRAVSDRIAVDLENLGVPGRPALIRRALEGMGFTFLDVDRVTLARSLIGRSQYELGAHLRKAPNVVDCSGLIVWLYGQCGIEVPRLSVDQQRLGLPVADQDLRPGDLVFSKRNGRLYMDDPAQVVGHVGIVSAPGRVIHATQTTGYVSESSLAAFHQSSPRGNRRFDLPGNHVVTLQIPPERFVRTERDFYWQLLGRVAKLAAADVA